MSRSFNHCLDAAKMLCLAAMLTAVAWPALAHGTGGGSSSGGGHPSAGGAGASAGGAGASSGSSSSSASGSSAGGAGASSGSSSSSGSGSSSGGGSASAQGRSGNNNAGAAAPTAPVDPDFTAGVAAVNAEQWPRAIASMQKVVTRDPRNADAFNYLGYSYRKSGDYAKAMTAYDQALKIEPMHKGALEYLGEAYLEMKQPSRAQEMLARLKTACTVGGASLSRCEEYGDLQTAMAHYKPVAASQ